MTIEEIALDIADEDSFAEIEASCPSDQRCTDHLYYNTQPLDPGFNEWEIRSLNRAVNYLLARGIIVPDPCAPHWVRLAGEVPLGEKSRAHFDLP